MEDAVRWNVKVSKEIDLTLRTYLGAPGNEKGRFLEIHRGCRPLAHLQPHRSGDQIANADADPDELQAIVDAAVHEARAARRTKRKVKKA